MSDQIKPCPWCGGEARLESVEYPKGRMSHWVACRDAPRCGVDGPTHNTESDAIAAWNRVAGAVEAAQKLLRTVDDVLIVPDMEVWVLSHGEVEGETVAGDLVACSMSLRYVGQCYSTKEAAEAALAKAKEAK